MTTAIAPSEMTIASFLACTLENLITWLCCCFLGTDTEKHCIGKVNYGELIRRGREAVIGQLHVGGLGHVQRFAGGPK